MPLTPEQLVTLRALLDRIIPPDESPGAVDAGVDTYLLRELGGDLAPHLNLYRTGLDELESSAHQQHQKDFAALTRDDQEAILSDFEREQHADSGQTERGRFLRTVCEHAAEGFYTSPIGWKMVGFKVSDPEVMSQ